MDTRKCSQCGKKFTLTDGEIDFYKSKNLHLPKRCKDCRNKNKADRISKTGDVTVYYGKSKHKGNVKMFSSISLKQILAAVIALVVCLFVFINYFNSPKDSVPNSASSSTQAKTYTYKFRNDERFTEHYNKHGNEVGALSKEDYLCKANNVINNPDVLQKTEAEDGDKVFFLADTGEIVFLSTDGYIRTYFIADYAYFQRT